MGGLPFKSTGFLKSVAYIHLRIIGVYKQNRFIEHGVNGLTVIDKRNLRVAAFTRGNRFFRSTT